MNYEGRRTEDFGKRRSKNLKNPEKRLITFTALIGGLKRWIKRKVAKGLRSEEGTGGLAALLRPSVARGYGGHGKASSYAKTSEDTSEGRHRHKGRKTERDGA